MKGYIFFGLTLLALVFYSLLGYYIELLTPNQIVEMNIATIYFIFILGFLLAYFLQISNIADIAFIPAFFFVNGYFWTKLLSNLFNQTKGKFQGHKIILTD